VFQKHAASESRGITFPDGSPGSPRQPDSDCQTSAASGKLRKFLRKPQNCRDGGTGRRSGLKIRRYLVPWGFDSPSRHHANPLRENQLGRTAAAELRSSDAPCLGSFSVIVPESCPNRARTDFPETQRIFAEQLLHCHAAASPLGSMRAGSPVQSPLRRNTRVLLSGISQCLKRLCRKIIASEDADAR
jgi:hypothetical protein